CLTQQKQLVSSPKPLLSTMNKVAQLSATISQGESSHNIDHNDAIVLSRCDLKTHICLAGWLFLSESYAWLSVPSRLGLHIPSRHTLIYPNWDGHPSMSAIRICHQLCSCTRQA